MKTGWHWEFVVIAPTGDPIPWTRRKTEEWAVCQLMDSTEWPFAMTQGYRVEAVRVERDHEALTPANIAGRIEIGRGARWGSGLV